jgi:hypothetical protein
LATGVPTLVEQPTTRGIRKVDGDPFHGLAADPSNSVPQGGSGIFIQSARQALRVQPSAPEDFVRHPIAHTGKSVLQEQSSLERQSGVAPEKPDHLGL